MTEDQIIAIRDAHLSSQGEVRKPARRLTEKQKRRLAAIESLTSYLKSYSREVHSLNYTDHTFIHDVLYGLGVALDPGQHKWASGYDVFKDVLRAHLAERP